jgi:UDP-glucose 4-epimerase
LGVRVVVIGATGNVGTAVLRALHASGNVDQLVGVARRLPPEQVVPGVQWRSVDIADDPLERLLGGADVVIHLAWRFQPTRNRRKTWATNVIGSLRTFDAAARVGVASIVYASSVGAYSPANPSAPDARVGEQWPTHAVPTAAYGTQKSYVERALDAFELANPDVRVVRTRSAFVFQRSAAHEQRRIFAGPFVPGRLLGSGRLPFLPLPRQLRFQAVHADDLAAAYVAAVFNSVSGAFNIAAEPVIGPAELAAVLSARTVQLPRSLVRSGFAAAFHAHFVPAEPGLLDLALSLPTMETSRARRELGWTPRHSATDAIGAFLAGLRDGEGGPTPPLAVHAGGPARIGELSTGLGQRE